MKYFNSKKIWITLIILVTVINLASLGAIVYLTYFQDTTTLVKRESYREEHRRHRKHPDKETRRFFDEVKSDFVEQVRPIAQELRHNQSLMMEELIQDNPDQATLDSLAEASGQLHARIKKQMSELFLKMNRKATPDQKQHLRRFYRHFMMEDRPGPHHERRKRMQQGKNFRQAPQDFCD